MNTENTATTETTEKDYSELNLEYDIELYKTYAYIMNRDITDIEDWKDAAEDNFIGEFGSYSELASHYLDDELVGLDLPKDIIDCIDYEKYGKILSESFTYENGYYWYNH